MLQKLETESMNYISKFKYFSEKEKDLSLKIQQIRKYLLAFQNDKYLNIFLKKIKKTGVMKRSVSLKTGIYNKLCKQKLERGVLYFEEDSGDEIGFRFLYLDEKDFQKVENILEEYLWYIDTYRSELDELLEEHNIRFQKLVLEFKL